MNNWTSSTLAILLALNPLCAVAAEQNPQVGTTKQAIEEVAKNVKTQIGDVDDSCSLYPTVEQQWERQRFLADKFLSRPDMKLKPTEVELFFHLLDLQAELHLQMIEEQCSLGEDITAINQVPAKYVDRLDDIQNILSWMMEPSFNDFMLGLQVILDNDDLTLEEQMLAVKNQCESFIKTEKKYAGEEEFYRTWMQYADMELAFIDRLVASNSVEEMNNVIAKKYGPKLDKLKFLLGRYQETLEMNQRA